MAICWCSKSTPRCWCTTTMRNFPTRIRPSVASRRRSTRCWPGSRPRAFEASAGAAAQGLQLLDLQFLRLQHRFQGAFAQASLRMLRLLFGAFDRREVLQWKLDAGRLEGFPGIIGPVDRAGPAHL